MKMIGWIALAITIAILAAIAWRVDDWSRDWTQNSARLSPESDNRLLQPLQMGVSVDEADRRIRDWVDSQTNWNVESVHNDDSNRTMHLTRTTPLFRFVDDVHVSIVPDPDQSGCRIDATSQSRVGKGDLGQNPRNLIELTKGVASEAP
ncbi:DUF1499 domain-containing protein [Roseiconus sp. JC912]